MLFKLDEIEVRYNSLRPTIESVIRNTSEFRAFQTYNSNRLELQGPDLQNTKEIIEGIKFEADDLRIYQATKAVKADKHLVDVLGIHQSNLLIERIATQFADGSPFRESDLRQLNKFCIQDNLYAGEYRETDRVNIGEFFDKDDPFWFAKELNHPVEVTWTDIPAHMAELCSFISKDHICPPLAASVVHAWFTHVHPFHDGNGRVARLLANLVLLRNSWPPIIVRHNEREDYLDALEESDRGGDIQLLFELFLKYIDLGLAELEKPEFFNKLYQLELRGNDERRVTLWSEKSRQFVDQLRIELLATGFSVERISYPSLSTYTLLEERHARGATLFGKIRNKDGRDIRVGVGYMTDATKRSGHVDLKIDGIHFPPTLYFQERNFLPGAEFPYVHRNDSNLEIKEITFSTGDKPCLISIGKSNKQVLPFSINDGAKYLAASIERLVFLGTPMRFYN